MRLTLPLLAAFALASPGASAQPSGVKADALARVERQRADLIGLSDRVWELAEIGFREQRSAELLAAHAEAQGFAVTRGVAGMPTAFVASYGSGRPVITIMGEYDALPGISQKPTAVKEPLTPGAGGHGCGHNLFGAASLGAAVAIKELIASGALKGTIRFLGTPAEETVGGKIYMIREGLFRDVDVALAWHPLDETYVDNEGAQANVQFYVEFHGRTAHAAGDPWNGRSAADAIEAFTHGVNLLREHVKPTVRMHYTVEKAGDVPNVVPDYARIHTWVRDSRRDGVNEVFARVKEIARGAALVAGVEHTIRVQTGYSDMNILTRGLDLLHGNFSALPPLAYTEEEQAYARALQKATGRPETGMSAALKPRAPIAKDPQGGSTDVGDVSWVVPTLHVYVATAPLGIPWHAWPVVAASRTSIGHKGMMFAAQGLAATAVDLFEKPEVREALRQQFDEQTSGVTYTWLVPDGPPPLPSSSASVGTAGLALAADAPSLDPKDDAAIREVVRLYNNAREARDPKAIEALFVADADQLVSSGEWRRGRDVLVKGALASSARTGGTRTLTVEVVRMVTPDAAIADARYEISGLSDGSTRRMWSTFVMARQGGAWRISAIRNMLPAAPAGGPPR